MAKEKVTISFDRDGEHCNTTEHSPYEALRYIVGSEFGFSCMLLELEETKVVVETAIMGCTDRSVFSGTKEAMAFVYKASCIYAAVLKQALDNGSQFSSSEAKLIQHVTKGNPRLIEMGAGVYAGARRVKMVNLTMLDPKTPEEIEKFAKLRQCDLETLVELKYDCGATDENIRQILETL